MTTTKKLKFNKNKLEYIDIIHTNKYLKKFLLEELNMKIGEIWRNMVLNPYDMKIGRNMGLNMKHMTVHMTVRCGLTTVYSKIKNSLAKTTTKKLKFNKIL